MYVAAAAERARYMSPATAATPGGGPSTVLIAQLKRKAIGQVQAALPDAAGSKAALVLCRVLFMKWAAWALGKEEDGAAHGRGQDQIMRLASHRSLPTPLLLKLINYTYMTAALHRGVPPWRPPAPTMEKLSPRTRFLIRAAPETQAVGAGFSATANNARTVFFDNNALASAIRQTQAYARYRTLVHCAKIQSLLGDAEYFFMTAQTVVYDLLAMIHGPGAASLNAYEECVRMSLLICVPTTTVDFELAGITLETMARQLRQPLLQTDLGSSWAPCTELLVYVLFYGAMIAGRDSGGGLWSSSQRPWRNCVSAPWCSSKRLLTRFFYLRYYRAAFVEDLVCMRA